MYCCDQIDKTVNKVDLLETGTDDWVGGDRGNYSYWEMISKISTNVANTG
jgi:hypothetical protein